MDALRFVHITDPVLCMGCRFAWLATVEKADGSQARRIQCRRGDCDNWEPPALHHAPADGHVVRIVHE